MDENGGKKAIEFIRLMVPTADINLSNLHTSLRDGVILCKMANVLSPNIIPKISSKPLSFLQMENISNFLKACQDMGLGDNELFTINDLYDGKGLAKVISLVLALEKRTNGGSTKIRAPVKGYTNIASNNITSVNPSRPSSSIGLVRKTSVYQTKPAPLVELPNPTADLSYAARQNQAESNIKAVSEFIEKQLKEPLPSQMELKDALKDGIILCRLMNILKPNSIPTINYKPLPFLQMENIYNFLVVAKNYGVLQSELFETGDLFEGRDFAQVVVTLLSIARLSGNPLRSTATARTSPFKNQPHQITKNNNPPDINSTSQAQQFTKNNNTQDTNSTVGTKTDRSSMISGERLSVVSDSSNIFVTPSSVPDRDLNILQSSEKPLRPESSDRKTTFIPPPPPKKESQIEVEEHTKSSLSNIEYLSINDEYGEQSEKTSDSKRSKKKSAKKNEEGLIIVDDDLKGTKLIIPNTHTGEDVEYQIGDRIGRGHFASVYRGLSLSKGEVVAIKHIKLNERNKKEVDLMMNEVTLLESLDHPNIVRYEGFLLKDGYLNIVLEFVENGSLYHTMKQFGSFPERLVCTYVMGILNGLQFLHARNVIHCDLKAANILTTKSGTIKLSDFGVSKEIDFSETDTSVAGTPNWMAPEIIELNGASTASDIWSTGCCIIELLTGKPPYADCNAMTALFRIVEDDSPPLPPNISSELTNFLSLCFQKDPLKRQTAIELLSHPWIKNQVRPNSANLLNANIKEINVNSKDGGSKLKGIERKDNDLPQPESTPNSSFKSQIGGGFSSVTSLESQKSKVPAKIDLENFSNSNLEPGSVPGSTNSLKPHGMQRIKNISKESLTLKTDPESLKRKKSPQINANSLSVTASMPVINQEKQSDQSSKQSVKKSTDKLSKREKKKDSCRIS